MSGPMLARFALAAAVAFTSHMATSALAQTAPSGAPSTAAIAIAKELIALKGGNVMFDSVVPGVIESAKNLFVPTNPNLSNELNEVAAQLRREFEPKKAELLNEVARTYARRFSEQELKDVVAFYKTTLGRKLLADEPLAIEDGLRRAQDWANEFSTQVIAKMRAEMKKKGHDL